jgi:hypothetical protein
LTVYTEILDLIPKLYVLLPIEEDADPTYFYTVVNAVRCSYASCYVFTIHNPPPSDASWLQYGPL